MALGTTAKLSNIKRSIDKYIHTNLVGTEELIIDFEGVPFDNKGKKEWVQPRILDTNRVFLRQASGTEYGSQASLLLHMNIFVAKAVPGSGVTLADRHYLIRDVVANYFKIGQQIGIANYIGGSTVAVGYLEVDQLVTDMSIPTKDEFNQYSLAWEIRWTELTTNPS